ncbi:hypothetical protein K457DRAFT_121858 [Linnemannia elongata AG-77]|uniref:Uncharacterized protein n=1 Tax=Linnemannia elongata AG-77 TaxID=1314771 RepID=A0A197K9I3_9FUNG|nr:hypothetical protein K457DRAFT_121858 [Linnemannia elongata AG-77]
MPTPIFEAGPSFIHLDTWDSVAAAPPENKQSSTSISQPSRSLSIHRATTTSSSSHNNNNNNTNNQNSIEHTTLILKRFTLSSDNHRSSSSSSSNNRRRGRPSSSRIRGKHGFVKALHANFGGAVNNHPASKEARSAQFKTYVQSRRLRLRQRGTGGLHPHHPHHQQHYRLQDNSDMSLDESEVHDEDDDNDNGYSDSEARDHVLDLDPEQYRNYMWELEQRLLERTESAAKSRSSFLMERRLSAGERLHHVQRVVQQQRTEQELRQHRVRDELEQKMVRAMARRNAYLEAAIENDPSRRFRRRGASSQTSSSSSAVTSSWNKSKATRTGSTTAAPISTASGATTTSTASSTGSLTTAPKRGTPSSSSSSKGVSSSMIRSKLKRDSVKSSKDKEINENNNNSSNNNSNSNNNNIKYTSEIQRDENGLHGQGQGLGSPKNSPFNMTQSRKAHLTNMTSVSPMSSSSSSSSSSSPVTLSPSSVENVERGGGETRAAGATFQDISKETGVSSATDIGGKARLERMTLWAQRRIRQRLVEKASREYMRAIGGSHQRVLGLKFEELARLLHTNKGLIQATVKLLRYSSQLAQMDRSIEQQQQDEYGEEVKKNPARVFLSMYMVLAHPSQIRSPSEVMF